MGSSVLRHLSFVGNAIMTVEHKIARGNLHFRTIAKKVGKEWYEWKVEVDEPLDNLKKIKKVEWILHPSFPERFHMEKTPDNKFALESEGWGEFEIVANIFFKDGEEKTFTVPLKFS